MVSADTNAMCCWVWHGTEVEGLKGYNEHDSKREISSYSDNECNILGVTCGQNHETTRKKVDHILNRYNIFLTSVQVILVSYCCLFCVLSNDMLIVSIDIFLK